MSPLDPWYIRQGVDFFDARKVLVVDEPEGPGVEWKPGDPVWLDEDEDWNVSYETRWTLACGTCKRNTVHWVWVTYDGGLGTECRTCRTKWGTR